MTDYKEVRITEHEQDKEMRLATFKVTQIIWLLLVLLEAGLALRVIFKLIGANSNNAFASLLYGLTGIFVAPFATLFPAPSAGGMVLEISTILAMIIYALIFWAIERIVYLIFYRPRGARTVNQTIVAEHTPVQSPLSLSQTSTTTHAPNGVTSQTTVTERIDPQKPQSE
jgi:hypothetical protein